MARGPETAVNELESQEPLLAFRQGDLDAFETLFRLHQRAVYGWILRMVRNPGAAEELTAETFWRIYRAHARFDPARGFAGLGAAHCRPRGAGLDAGKADGRPS